MIAWQECPRCGGVFAIWDAAYSTNEPPKNHPGMSSAMFVNREGEHYLTAGSEIGETRCLDCGVSIAEMHCVIGHSPIDNSDFWRCAETLLPVSSR